MPPTRRHHRKPALELRFHHLILYRWVSLADAASCSHFISQSPNTTIDFASRKRLLAIAVRHTVSPFAGIHASIFCCQFPLAVSLAISPLAFIQHATGPCRDTIAAAISFHPCALVYSSIRVRHFAQPFSFVALPLAIVNFAIRPLVDAPALLFVAFPLSVVRIAVIPAARPGSILSPFIVRFACIFDKLEWGNQTFITKADSESARLHFARVRVIFSFTLSSRVLAQSTISRPKTLARARACAAQRCRFHVRARARSPFTPAGR